MNHFINVLGLKSILAKMETAIVGVFIILLFMFLVAPGITHAQTWLQTNGPEGGQIRALAYNSSGDLYAGLFVYGYNPGAIFRSSNDGATWTRTGYDNDAVASMAINSSDHIFVGTWTEGIQRSTDAGSNWTELSEGLPTGSIVALAINSSDHIYAGLGAAGVYLSTDNGENWTESNNGLTELYVYSLAINSSGDIFAGTKAGIFRSTDNGSNWTEINSALPTESRLIVFAIAFNSSGHIIIGTEHGVFRSTDNGDNWTGINNGFADTTPFVKCLAINSSDNIFAGLSEHYGGNIYRSTDNGANWYDIDGGISVNNVSAFLVNNSDHIFAGTNNGCYKSTNNGDSWNISNGGMVGTYIEALAIHQNGDILAGDRGAGVYYTDDYGDTWSQISNGLVDYLVRAIAINTAGDIFAGTELGVWISIDNGSNWTEINNGITEDFINVLEINNSGDIFAGTNGGGIFRSSDNGSNWVEINSGLTSDRVLAITFNSSGDLFIGTVSEGVFRSTTNGDSWTQTALNDRTVNSIIVDSDDYIYGGTSSGLYYSDNNGSSWTLAGGIGYKYVKALTTDAYGGIYAGTFYSGEIYYSPDNGINWSILDAGAPDRPILSLVIGPANYLFAGTICSGVYRLALPYTVTRLDDDENPGSLRWAINMANSATPNQADIINFLPSLTGTIYPNSELPALTDPQGVDIQGETSIGGITIDGLNLLGGESERVETSGIILDNSSFNTISDLEILNFKFGININSNSSINIIDNNLIRQCYTGIFIEGSNNLIRTNTLIENNDFGELSGGTGIKFFGAQSFGNGIYYNYVGTNLAGEPGLGNGIGIYGTDGSFENYIVLNIISGNASGGISLGGNSFEIFGNRIGTTTDGHGLLANGHYGISLGGTAQGNLIGGSGQDQSGNVMAGSITNLTIAENATGNYIYSNRIGTNIDGTVILGCGTGIWISGYNNYIGAPGEGNIISGHTSDGIKIQNGSLNTLSDNKIGTDITGQLDFGNGGNGIIINCIPYSGNSANNNLVTLNHIVYNLENGIQVYDIDCQYNTLSENIIFENSRLGIDLGNDGVTTNDTGDDDDGPNELLNFPEFNSAKINSTDSKRATVTGTAGIDYIVELFKADGAGISVDPSGHGEGLEFIASTVADGSRNFSFSDVPTGFYYTATATDPTGNTSEFAANYLVESNEIIVVNSNSSGAGSLAAAIEAANSREGRNLITFAPSVTDPIVLTTELPALSDASGGTTIDGCSAPGGAHSIVLDGSGMVPSGSEVGLYITSDDNEICGLVIINFPSDGIFIGNASYNRVYNNYIGVESDGNTGAGNGAAGIFISGNTPELARGNDIGSTGGNVISDNAWDGIYCYSTLSTIISNNFIGINSDGTSPLPNNTANTQYIMGIFAAYCNEIEISNNLISGNNSPESNYGLVVLYSLVGNISDNKIGTDVTGYSAIPNNNGMTIQHCEDFVIRDNLISGNDGWGLFVVVSQRTNVIGNYVGTNVDGMGALSNSGGVAIQQSTISYIGSTIASERNIISGNVGDGISILEFESSSGSQAPGEISKFVRRETMHIIIPGENYLIDKENDRRSNASPTAVMQYTYVLGNYIGVGADGETPIPNVGNGIEIELSGADIIGGPEAGAGNIISNNSGYGVFIDNSVAITIMGNQIEENGSGAASLHNGTNGCMITNNTILNNGQGIWLQDGSTYGNLMIDNIIYGSIEGPDIDLYPAGITYPGNWDPVNSPNEMVDCPQIYAYWDGESICGYSVWPPNAEIIFYLALDYDAMIDATYEDEFGNSHGGAIIRLGSGVSDGSGFMVDHVCDIAASMNDVITALTVDNHGNSSEFGMNFILEPAIFGVHSPIELVVEDPYGNSIGREFNSIPGATYDESTDYNEDGDLDDYVFLPGRLSGKYTVKAMPLPEANPGDTYTLVFINGDVTTTIVEDVPVPPYGEYDEYEYDSIIPTLFTCGDVNGDELVNILDVVYLINYKYKEGPAPDPLESADVNSDELVNILDVVYLINYKYKDGPEPDCP